MYRTEFENLRVYQLAEELADLTWKVVGTWGHLAQETVGIQLIKSADSIGTNIAEGSGRGSPAEKRDLRRSLATRDRQPAAVYTTDD